MRRKGGASPCRNAIHIPLATAAADGRSRLRRERTRRRVLSRGRQTVGLLGVPTYLGEVQQKAEQVHRHYR